jgi:hypothetical protein
LRLTGLEIEKAEDQRAGEAEHRGREGGRHAGERTGEAGLELVEDAVDVAPADAHALDHVRDRAHGLQQAPEGAEQAEEDHESGGVAGEFPAFVEPAADPVEQAAHGLRGEGDAAFAPGGFGPGGEHAGHGREQLWRHEAGEALARALVIAHPGDLGLQPQDLSQVPDDAEQKDEEDEGIERRVTGEEDAQLGNQESPDGDDGPKEDEHPDQVSSRPCHKVFGPLR